MANSVNLASAVNPAPATVTSAVNVQLQLAAVSVQLCVVEYGISFASPPSGAAITLRTSATGQTLTTACMTPDTFSNPNAPASLTTTTTSTSAFMNNATAVAPATTALALLDAQLLSTNTYIKQFPLGREPTVAAGDFLQIVVTAGVATTCYAYFIWRE
jgi:hypothetical protein